ncbi:MAG: glycoside hydrolase family 95 protein, partial [Lachnospiraceae bacterium]|nr:glycoside hydrolase family 95 protein [Lachnospiraceae bacterium]
MSKLWYKTEAKCWEEALPLGNGRLGAMVFGNPVNERIQVNEESMWYGGPCDRNNPDGAKNLPMIRKLILNGKINEAERLMKYSLSGCPESQHPYQTLGDIYMDFYGITSVQGYQRCLDIDNAVYDQIFGDEDTTYTRLIYISKPDDIMVIHLSAAGKKKLDLDVKLRRDRFFDGVRKLGENGITLYGNLGKGGFDFALCLTAKVKNGSVKVIGEHIVIKDATEAVLYFCADTTYHVNDVDVEGLIENVHDRIKKCEDQKLSELKERHVKDYKLLFNRIDLEIDEKENFDSVPTDERIASFQKNRNKDTGLCELYFDYGRYLLIACSRKGTLPATLQGLWNDSMTPAWDSKYTININTQMNYWPAESTNLSECHEPLFELIKKLSENGKKTAKEMYGAKGWVAHHNTDIWG